MTDYLLDTNILIRCLRKTVGYRELLTTLAASDWLTISAMTRFEVIRGMRDHERESTFDLLNSLETLTVSAEIADAAGEIVRTGRTKGFSHEDADAVIAATAMQHNLALVTTNARHFSMHNLVVYEADAVGKITLRE
ncbi:MAG TPA: PIN domain-containing protein [Anaerolineales bacterium]|nr:PIN domain-containing protein [Anaerolineales bacterium]HNQ95919.1 PIN domain-containing protein [Anaerolineales bacterium]HNS59918.1 PIN domain-containing protein [Anaerolineales bacterium]